MIRKASSLLLLFVVAVVFIVAGGLKAKDPAAFAEDIRNYRIVPWSANVVLALYLPWLEIAIGGGLLWRRTRGGGLLLALGMLLVFLVAIASAWWRGLNISCGCFGSGTPSPDASHALLWDMGRDVVLLLSVAWLLFREAKIEKRICEN
ncbi:MAG: MauE/DoxX family redox-associated membrane protein [Chthoniobacteraceae bacterium]